MVGIVENILFILLFCLIVVSFALLACFVFYSRKAKQNFLTNVSFIYSNVIPSLFISNQMFNDTGLEYKKKIMRSLFYFILSVILFFLSASGGFELLKLLEKLG